MPAAPSTSLTQVRPTIFDHYVIQVPEQESTEHILIKIFDTYPGRVVQNGSGGAQGRVSEKLYGQVAPDAARPGLLLQGVKVEDDGVSVVGHRGSQPRQTAHPGQGSINSQE